MQSGRAFLVLYSTLCFAQPDVFRSDVSVVRVDASVVDGERVVDGLGRKDFRILDNNEPRSLMSVSRDDEPLDLVLLFDISGSMRPNVLKVAGSADVALKELRRGDRVAIMVFNRSTRLILPLTSDLVAVEEAVRRDVLGMEFGGGTRILSSVDDAAKYLISQPRDQRRRAVLIITDNIGTRSRRESTVVNRMWEADASLSGLMIQRTVDRWLRWSVRIQAPHMSLLEEGIEGVCEKTGGDIVRGDDPGDAFRDLMARVRRRYSLLYAMPDGTPGEMRRIRVDLSEDVKRKYPAIKVRARTSYRIPGEMASK